MKKGKICFLLFLIAGAIGITPTVKRYVLSPQPLWKNQPHDAREIASFKHLVDPLILEDYFINESYNKYMSYELEPRFWTSLDGKYLKTKASLALHETFTKTFIQMEKENEHNLTAVFKKNLLDTVVNQYIKTLNFYKIFNGAFQFDFNFTPKEHRFLTYDDELSSNQLVIHNKKNNLHQMMVKPDHSWAKAVHLSKTPHSGEQYQYNGGSISVWLKLLDLNLLKLQNPVPNPKKNALKGYIRYRKYFRVNEPSKINLEINNDLISSKMLHFKKNSKENFIYMTVDIYQKFNLKSMIPQNDKMVINFGSIIPNNLNRDSIFKDMINMFSNEKKIETATLTLRGETKSASGKQKFRTKIETLVYSFVDKKFTNHSKIHTKLHTSYRSSQGSGHLKLKIKNSILKNNKQQLIKAFHLDKFSSDLGQ